MRLDKCEGGCVSFGENRVEIALSPARHRNRHTPDEAETSPRRTSDRAGARPPHAQSSDDVSTPDRAASRPSLTHVIAFMTSHDRVAPRMTSCEPAPPPVSHQRKTNSFPRTMVSCGVQTKRQKLGASRFHRLS